MMEKRGSDSKELELDQLKHLSTKIQEPTSNVVIIEKKFKTMLEYRDYGPKAHFQIKLPQAFMVLLRNQ